MEAGHKFVKQVTHAGSSERAATLNYSLIVINDDMLPTASVGITLDRFGRFR
jgi:hypothetical protein